MQKWFIIVLIILIGLIGAVLILLDSFINPKQYGILSVSTTDAVTVKSYALARVKVAEDFPVDTRLLEGILAEDRGRVPEYISDIVVYKGDSLHQQTPSVSDLPYTRAFSHEFTVAHNDTILLVLQTDTDALLFSYIKHRPSESHLLLQDGSLIGPGDSVQGSLYFGADVLMYPVLIAATLEEGKGTAISDFITNDIRVLVERVGYVPDHHGVFAHQGHE